MMRQPLIKTASIVIPTFNRADSIGRVLASLGHLSPEMQFEVIVINGPSTDETAELLRHHYADKIKILHCPIANVSMSRNMGIAEAAGDMVVFVDDDAIPVNENWLLGLANSLNSNPIIGATGGFVIQGNADEYGLKYCASTEYAVLHSYHIENENALPKGYHLYFNGCNAAMPTHLLKSIGGFDEYFAYYLEEPDICIRLARYGFKIHIDPNPSMAVRHFPNPSGRHSMDVMMRSDAYFCMKNASDPLELRIQKTQALFIEKSYLQHPRRLYESGLLSQEAWDQLDAAMARGVAQGLADGIDKERLLKRFTTPPAFKQFPLCRPKQKLRVALLSKTLPQQNGANSIGRYMYDLAQGLHELGHEIHILHQGDQEHHEALNFTLHGVRSSLNGRPSNLAQRNNAYSHAVVTKLLQLEQVYGQFDVIHASTWDAEAWGAIVSRRWRVVLMLTSALAQVAQSEQWDITDDLMTCLQIDKWQLTRADAVFVPSDHLLQHDDVLPNVQRIKPGIVPNAQALSLLQTPRPQNTLKRLLFVGAVTRSNGAHRLLEVLPSLLTQFRDWECHFVGDDQIIDMAGQPLKTLVTEQWQHTDWFRHVYFHGKVGARKLDHHYQTCDLFVLPAIAETLGVAFYGAMQCGKAVVGYDTPVMQEIVMQGKEGILVTPDSPQALLQALTQLMEDEEWRVKLGQTAYQRVSTDCHYKKMAWEVEQCFLKLLNDGQSHPTGDRLCLGNGLSQ